MKQVPVLAVPLRVRYFARKYEPPFNNLFREDVRFIEMYLVESSNIFSYSLQGRETGVTEEE